MAMKRKLWWLGLATLTAIALITIGQIWQSAPSRTLAQTTLAQTTLAQAEAPQAVPIDPLPGSRTSPPPVSPSPVVSPSPSPVSTATPSPGQSPAPDASPAPGTSPSPTPTPAVPLPPPPPSFTPTAAPLPVKGMYLDPTKRFQVNKLEGFMTAPLGDSVLLEKSDGSLAYTVLAPSIAQLGAQSGITNENLLQIAKNAVQKGEGFQITNQIEVANGMLLDWVGQLTIAGRTQPMTGKILVRPTSEHVLLLILAATESGNQDLEGAIAALLDSLQSGQPDPGVTSP
ncbi:MAG: hypothetical protein VKJ24_12560 [Synechococcales bacterium]|nr:hypothetical protein [Synechococcales bacterium]